MRITLHRRDRNTCEVCLKKKGQYWKPEQPGPSRYLCLDCLEEQEGVWTMVQRFWMDERLVEVEHDFADPVTEEEVWEALSQDRQTCECGGIERCLEPDICPKNQP